MSTPITNESIKKYLQDNKYTKIIFSPKGDSEIWDDLPSNYPDFKVQPGEQLPHDNFVKITYFSEGIYAHLGGRQGSHGSFLEEIKETNNDFLTELFKWAQQEKVKRIEVEEQWEIVIHKKTQQDYQRDEAVKKWRGNKMVNSYASTCPYCNKQLGVSNRLKDTGSDKKIRLQHWESCSSCPEEIRTMAKKKLGELPTDSPRTNEGGEYNRLTGLIRDSKTLTELERNYQTVKSSPLYDSNKRTWNKYEEDNKTRLDKTYNDYKHRFCTSCLNHVERHQTNCPKKCKKCNHSVLENKTVCHNIDCENYWGKHTKIDEVDNGERERERETNFRITNWNSAIRTNC